MATVAQSARARRAGAFNNNRQTSAPFSAATDAWRLRSSHLHE
jgi:hypothetical protein